MRSKPKLSKQSEAYIANIEDLYTFEEFDKNNGYAQVRHCNVLGQLHYAIWHAYYDLYCQLFNDRFKYVVASYANASPFETPATLNASNPADINKYGTYLARAHIAEALQQRIPLTKPTIPLELQVSFQGLNISANDISIESINAQVEHLAKLEAYRPILLLITRSRGDATIEQVRQTIDTITQASLFNAEDSQGTKKQVHIRTATLAIQLLNHLI